ncbi:MAG: glycoside hydrolase family 31 protein [Gorillibacterium sp.]|nr:glycoside hydrolase family 31 protein [Gorillibacterium sp.]
MSAGSQVICFGTVAIKIGPAGPNQAVFDERLPYWDKAVVLDGFYQAGGGREVKAATTCRMVWHEKGISILVICEDRLPLSPLNGEEKTELRRPEEIHVAFHTNSMGFNTFLRVKVGDQGDSVAARKTVHPEELGSDEHRDSREEEPVTDYSSQVIRDSTGWKALIEIPWSILGGKPETFFGTQVMRCRLHTEENSTPFPLDLYVNYTRELYDPLMFMEASLAEEPENRIGQTMLETLPSGRRLWQRPVKLVWPTNEERHLLADLQDNLADPTSPDNLEIRLHLAGRWQDLLTLEGFDFFYNMAASYPWPLVEPWRARHLVNCALAQGDAASACVEADRFLQFLGKASRWWFADGTPGNIQENTWSSVGSLLQVQIEEYSASLTFGSEGQQTKHRLTLSFPQEGGVRLTGDHEGYFHPCGLTKLSVIERSAELTQIRSGPYTVTFISGPEWSLDIIGSTGKAGRVSINYNSLRLLLGEEGLTKAVDLALDLREKEEVFGFGERFDAFSQRGNILTLWQRDAWEGCFAGIRNQSYKNIPFFHSSNGYSLFWNSSYRLRADVGKAETEKLRLTIHGPVLDLYVWPDSPQKALEGYTHLTGKPLLPPKWAFEPWAGGGGSRWKEGPLKNLTKEMIGVMDRFEREDIPHSALYAEGAGPDEMLFAEMNKKKIKVLTWDFSVIIPSMLEAIAESFPEADWPLLDNPESKTFFSNVNYTDFTHPRAMEFYRLRWKPRLDIGFAGTMIDFGDVVADSAIFHDGRRGQEMHNFYYYDYTKAYQRMFEERRGDDFVLFQRGAAAGSQAHAGCFAGDHPSNFPGMTAALRGGLTIATCGFPFWGSDIGGYDGHPCEEVYVRWVEWGTFTPFMRFHGTSPREPWIYNEATVQLYKKYAWIRENLLDYSYSAAVHAHHTGEPMMVPMAMAFPNYPEILSCDDQYLYGSDLMIAPVHEEGGCRRLQLPPGKWTHLWSGKTTCGPEDIQLEVPLGEIPVYLRSGATLPVRLSESLQLGESLSQGSLDAWILTPPEAKIEQVRWLDRDCSVQVTLVPVVGGFYMEVTEGRAVQALVVYGMEWQAKEIVLNGTAVPHITAETSGNGWYVDENRTILRMVATGSFRVEFMG